ncbi:hypothetical protein DTO013E5_3181 [Penicillium roqueforti]|uniref:Genomic scaffold, ProqFM164S03 n=1 Tax=Penicillium roqueforti (strain FM164) TaxID=1365484 RepID=W6QDW8_PENRF|nr:hypothetical protein LCP963914a_4247 [Penicillium roqueforti]CDM34918.1 unnamed protein product [Penicillium roqueforti FM164]KAI2704366.1 hypothetical protein CBS147372_2835 [Penicillium roqueforti]KAI2715942.1 hypothetical protein CBS147318_5793 [Penicillium roqueforti]KAI2717418.1 hypothetical protein CBS147332_4298 [Penicillium roqueforti]
MAPSHSFILFLSFVLSCVQAAPWIVTEVYEQDVTTDYYSEVVTEVHEITPTATLPAEALSTITSTDTIYDYTVVEKLYPTGYGTALGFDAGYDTVDSDGNYHSTIYQVNLTFSAPTACSTQWTITTAAAVTPPYEIAALLPRDNVITSTSVDSAQPFQTTTYIYEIVFVEPTQIPSPTLSSLSSYNAPTSRYIGSKCQYTDSSDYSGNSGYYTGLSSGPGTTGYSGGSSGYYDYDYDDYNWFTSTWGSGIGISYLAIVLICALGWIGIVFILGMIEAWVRFRRLMTGWQTRRGFPLFWSFILLPLSLFCLFCFRKGYRARSKEDAVILKKRWDAMSFWTKMRLFFAWGFRFKYPTVLGPAPATVKASKRPDESGPRLLDVTPPGTSAPSRAASTEVAPAAGPEMAQAPAQPHAAPEASGALPGHDVEAGPVH